MISTILLTKRKLFLFLTFFFLFSTHFAFFIEDYCVGGNVGNIDQRNSTFQQFIFCYVLIQEKLLCVEGLFSFYSWMLQKKVV